MFTFKIYTILEIVDKTALRMFVHKLEGVFTGYLCNIEV
jgi:hypothetical protein